MTAQSNEINMSAALSEDLSLRGTIPDTSVGGRVHPEVSLDTLLSNIRQTVPKGQSHASHQTSSAQNSISEQGNVSDASRHQAPYSLGAHRPVDPNYQITSA